MPVVPGERKGGVGSVQWQREPREGDTSCVCPYINVRVVSWIREASRCPHGAMRGASAPYQRGYAHAQAALCRGLDGMLLAALAHPVG
jgi:hypothetical protein